MGKIRQLDQKIASQIAAGEVIERPLSVIKELCENSLDAGAKNIDIHIKGGGLNYIVIQDDGEGMDEEDARLAFCRYATSKLGRVSDLECLKTFGFRGEALPSIASVARIKMLTRLETSEYGIEAIIEGGDFVSLHKSSCAPGTRIEVRDLFYNVPVRKDFLKSSRSEGGLIERLVRSLAVFYPEVGFRLKIEDRLICDLKGIGETNPMATSEGRNRALELLGRECEGQLFYLDERSSAVRLYGYVSSPLVNRRDGRGMMVFVNGRLLEDRKLTGALKASFRTILEVGRQPIFALGIEVDEKKLDVNVHPRKMEVRFADEALVHSHIIRLLSNFLAQTPWLKGAKNLALEPETRSLEERISAFRVLGERISPDPLLKNWPKIEHRETSLFETNSLPNVQAGYANPIGFNALRAVGQINATYLLLEGENALVVIDQHAAHERLMFEKIRALFQKGKGLESTPLLFPISVTLDAIEMNSLSENRALLLNYGIEADPISENTALIRSLPIYVKKEQPEMLLKELLGEMATTGRSDAASDLLDHFCATLACHSSVRAGQKLSSEEISALLKELDGIEYGAHCPHGRPVVRSIYFNEIKKWFSRP